jgi:F-type H+-transporting ATPase subunit c
LKGISRKGAKAQSKEKEAERSKGKNITIAQSSCHQIFLPPSFVNFVAFCSVRNRVRKTTKENPDMDGQTLVAVASIVLAGLTIAIGSVGPALAQGRALAEALRAIAQQPDESGNIVRTLFVGMAMVESTAIYCFVVSMILIFANPFAGQ